MAKRIKIVAFGDTHGCHSKVILPECDITIFTGDWSCNTLTIEDDLTNFAIWFGQQRAKWKIVIAGNHDFVEKWPLEKTISEFARYGILYLQDAGVCLNGITLYGSPWTTKFNNWAFGKNEFELNEIWQTLPDNVDILITHGPPKGILDYAHHQYLGSSALKDSFLQCKPRIHVFGHIHEQGGKSHKAFGILHYNVALLDEFYHLVRKPKIFYISPKKSS